MVASRGLTNVLSAVQAPISRVMIGTSIRSFAASSDKAKFKVCVSGGAGGIGQPLSMLMGMNPLVKELSIQDVTMSMVPAAGVAADLSHLEFPSKVNGYAMDPSKPAVDQLEECLTGCHLVLIPAGVPRKPGMTRDDLFAINAGIAKGLVEACIKFCPDAVIGLIVNPVNSVVPAMCELYKKKGTRPQKNCWCYDFGHRSRQQICCRNYRYQPS